MQETKEDLMRKVPDLLCTADQKVALLGAMQSLFEGSMYTFVFLWTPALSPNGEHLPHGNSQSSWNCRSLSHINLCCQPSINVHVRTRTLQGPFSLLRYPENNLMRSAWERTSTAWCTCMWPKLNTADWQQWSWLGISDGISHPR